MADHQKIHPAPAPEPQQEALPKTTAPLVPRGSSRSENGDPERQQPPLRRSLTPYSPSKQPKKRSCCKKCLCWSCCLFFLLIILLGILAAIIYFVFQPKIPKYSVDSMRITQFNINNDMSLSATFNVSITARNPNKKIGIYYENGSHLSVWYKGTNLCEGSLPKFYQGHRNTTVLNVKMTGQTENATNLLQSLQVDQQSGTIPLNLRVKVPVRIKLGKLKLTKWKFLLKCRLNVDSLSQDNVIRIRDNKCKVRFRF
ncbi:NDR1/HIN1-like protein 6 [Nicotiana tabacum]|uniref:NDR1/HIN1-like protein 6 n=1 Tax=Nicotiana tabacum TaxID=4097 RepID=A0A1S4AMY7_TOBAC